MPEPSQYEAKPNLFLSRDRGKVTWWTVKSMWAPTTGWFLLDGLPAMLVGEVIFWRGLEPGQSGVAARFGMN